MVFITTTMLLFRLGPKYSGIVNPVLKSGVTYLESLLLGALHWKTLIHCLPALSPSTHQQLRYHGDRILDSFCKNNLKAALLVIKILFHIHVFVQHNSLDFMVLTTPNRSNKKDYSFHYYHRDKLNEKLLTPLCYFNFRWDNRPF